MENQKSIESSNCKPTFQFYLDKLSEEYESSKGKDTRWYTRIVTDCNKYIPSALRHTAIADITPQMLQEAINRVCRLGGKRYQSIASGIRNSFRLASLDDAISSNPALSVHIREINSTTSTIDDELYHQILKQVRVVPGGYLFGIAGFADTSLESVTTLAYEECDEHAHTLLFHRNNKQKIAHVVDPDGVAIVQGAIELYQQRMSNPGYAATNSKHILCTNRFGLPYERKQLSTIVELLRDACNSPIVDVTAFRKHIRYRQL